MELYEQNFVDLVAPGFLSFDGGEGEMRFIDVGAFLDVRYVNHDGTPMAEFSWRGFDEDEEKCGRGWVVAESDQVIRGHFYFHMGDDSSFTCRRLAN